MELSYDDESDKVGLYENLYGMLIVNFWNEEQRDLLVRAIEKAEEWSSVARDNKVEQLNKVILPDEKIILDTYYNSGEGWWPDGLWFDYQFLIAEINGKLMHLFLIRYRTADDMNTGSFGQCYAFRVGEETKALKNCFTSEAVKGYRDSIIGKKDTESLFN